MVGSTNQTGRLTSSLSTLDESFEVFVVSGSFSPDELRGIQRRFRQSSSGISIADFVRLAIEVRPRGTLSQQRQGLVAVGGKIHAADENGSKQTCCRKDCRQRSGMP